MLKSVHDDKCAEINGRQYHITKVNHKKRRKVFAFFSKVQNDVKYGNMWFLDSQEWADVEKTIENVVTFEGNLLSKLPDHWDNYPEDYLVFVSTMMGALSYPFLSGFTGG